MLNEDKKCEISIKLYHQLIGYDNYRRDNLQFECESLKKSPKAQQKPKTPLPIMKQNLSKDTEMSKCISSSLKLVESREAGKYFTANGEIESCETVLVEKAKCACLYPKNFGTHCNHCFAR